MAYPAAWLRGASLGEAITCELRLSIVTGKLKPGEKLSENRIAADFGTSRSPVREALRVLSDEGLIRLERMGAVVLGLSEAEVKELFDVRYLIESFVQERLSRMDREPIIGQLERIIDKMELAAKHRDIEEFALQDFSFHETIVAEAKHSRIWQLWRSIRQLVLSVMLVTTQEVFGASAARIEAVIEKHRIILRSLRSGSEEEIQKQVRNYFADSYETLHHSLGKS
ncbi:GntR family transcriptional regulator [Cohnella thailandensis]|uniref:GntR family transcriptional regulator n=1 Tax=Cohnella thailandensis TaxID=557557 RepID=A0A841T1E8_9BACL|nr:GntR family transcriptional regulator [Cohnella thailandensis]MBB6636879.1 GntR family transcriptional regulator [Cohnella thailandensis]MBP1973241.1 GntR family transcriptional regulator of gluconate operon [Cohnella thailandensis]